MTKEESRAVSFVGVLLVLAVVARFVTKPKPVMITAGPVDIAALRAAGEALVQGPGHPKPKGRGRRIVRTSPPKPAAPVRPTEPGWRRPRVGPLLLVEPDQGRADGPVNVNRASAEQLDGLPGVSPAVAKRIVARRDSVGRFGQLEDLDVVKGVGPALLAKLRGKVVFR